MADKKVDLARQEALEAENRILKEQLARGKEEAYQDAVEQLGGNISNEIKKIRAKGKSKANTITVVEQNDHVNVSLWTKWGKRIGPLHPDNAIQTLQRFADIGIVLKVDKPTPEQMDAWAKTAEGKAFFKKESDRRAIKDKTRRSGQMEKLAADIARMSGTTVDAIHHILSASEVRK